MSARRREDTWPAAAAFHAIPTLAWALGLPPSLASPDVVEDRLLDGPPLWRLGISMGKHSGEVLIKINGE